MRQSISLFKKQPRPLLLESGVQHYAWGGLAFIPALLGIDNSEKRPYAELWMGAHPDLPSQARLGDTLVPLNELIAAAADEILGPQASVEFSGRLPFLLKVLSAKAPLSIQAHPTVDRAREGFARESAKGIPLTARERNYKDENHKPELIVALTEFYALRGFRPLDEIAQTLEEVPELRRLQGDLHLNSSSLKSLYGKFMNSTPEEVDLVLDPLVKRLFKEDEEHSFTRMEREFWLLKADAVFSGGGHRDRGLLSIYLLNLTHLEPGEAMFLPAGILHAYLEGSGMEIMASSNNVLRGGLTPKHVDVPELLNNLVFESGPMEILEGALGKGEWIYKTPAREFELSRIQVSDTELLSAGRDHGAEILVLVESSRHYPVTITATPHTIELQPGHACLVPQGLAYSVHATDAATLFRAAIPPAAPTDPSMPLTS